MFYSWLYLKGPSHFKFWNIVGIRLIHTKYINFSACFGALNYISHRSFQKTCPLHLSGDTYNGYKKRLQIWKKWNGSMN